MSGCNRWHSSFKLKYQTSTDFTKQCLEKKCHRTCLTSYCGTNLASTGTFEGFKLPTWNMTTVKNAPLKTPTKTALPSRLTTIVTNVQLTRAGRSQLLNLKKIRQRCIHTTNYSERLRGCSPERKNSEKTAKNFALEVWTALNIYFKSMIMSAYASYLNVNILEGDVITHSTIHD